jgi:hypothetical protein
MVLNQILGLTNVPFESVSAKSVLQPVCLKIGQSRHPGAAPTWQLSPHNGPSGARIFSYSGDCFVPTADLAHPCCLDCQVLITVPTGIRHPIQSRNIEFIHFLKSGVRPSSIDFQCCWKCKFFFISFLTTAAEARIRSSSSKPILDW